MRNIINARLKRWDIIKTCLKTLSIHKPILYISKSSLYLNQTNNNKKDFGFGHPLKTMGGKHVPVLPLIICRQPKVLWNMTFWKSCKIHLKCVKALCLSNKPWTHSFSYFSNFLASIEAVLQKERSALNSGICEDSNCHRIDLLWRKAKANQSGSRLNTGGCLSKVFGHHERPEKLQCAFAEILWNCTVLMENTSKRYCHLWCFDDGRREHRLTS